MRCHCQSLQPFVDCCAPYLSGQRTPATPLALMRSRYTAFVLGNGEYLLATWHPDTKGSLTVDELAEAGRASEWLGLAIIFSRIEVDGEHGVVEFKARYREQGRVLILHEQSSFERIAGVWRYKNGVLNPPRIGANQPCPCGVAHQGMIKKYKHCCATR